MAKIKIKQTRSEIGKIKSVRETIKALGLRKVRQIVEKEDTPQIRGMINKVNHMVKIVE